MFNAIISIEDRMQEYQTLFQEYTAHVEAVPLDTLPPEDAQASQSLRSQISANNDRLKRELDRFYREMPVKMEELHRSIMPTLIKLMNVLPEDEDQPDIVWVRKWLTQPEHNVEEVKYFHTHFFKALAEALAILCPMLNQNRLEEITLFMIPIFEIIIKSQNYEVGFISNRFNTWIINAVVDPEIFSESYLRLEMLLLYRFLKIDESNYEGALKSVISAFSYINIHQETVFASSTKKILDCLNLFHSIELDERVLCQLGVKLAEKLIHHRNKRKRIAIQDISYKYAMGLKTMSEPKELLCLTAILKSISDQTCRDYKAFQEDPNNGSHIKRLDESSCGLAVLTIAYKAALEEPELLDITSECVINVMETVIRSKYKQIQDGNGGDVNLPLFDVNLFLTDLADCTDGHYCAGRVGKEIIRRYKKRICRLRLQIPKEFMDEDQMICAIIYNSEY